MSNSKNTTETLATVEPAEDHEFFDCITPGAAENDSSFVDATSDLPDVSSAFKDFGLSTESGTDHKDSWDPFPTPGTSKGPEPIPQAEPPVVIDETYRLEEEALLTDEELELRKTESIQLKTDGNNHFGVGDFEAAIQLYDQALDKCPLRFKETRAMFLGNRAAAHLKLEDFESGLKDCSKAIELDPTYLKAYYRRALCAEQKEENWDTALKDYEFVLTHDPNNEKAKDAVRRLPGMIAQRNERMKEEMMGKLKDLGNLVLRPFGLSTDNFQMEQNAEGGYSVKFQQ